MNIYTARIADQLVTVLGETPPVTVMQIARVCRPKGPLSGSSARRAMRSGRRTAYRAH